MRGFILALCVSLTLVTASAAEVPSTKCDDKTGAYISHTKTDKVKLCEPDITKLQNQYLILSNIDLNAEQLKAKIQVMQLQLQALSDSVPAQQEALAKVVDDLRKKYALGKDYEVTPDLTFERQKTP